MKMQRFPAMKKGCRHERAAKSAGGTLDIEEKGQGAAQRHQRSPAFRREGKVMDQAEADPEQNKQNAGDRSLRVPDPQSNY